MTQRDFFKLSAFLRAWEGDSQGRKLQVTFSFTILWTAVANTDEKLRNTSLGHQKFLFLQGASVPKRSPLLARLASRKATLIQLQEVTENS